MVITTPILWRVAYFTLRDLAQLRRLDANDTKVAWKKPYRRQNPEKGITLRPTRRLVFCSKSTRM